VQLQRDDAVRGFVVGQQNGKLNSHDFITSSHVTSRFWSMAMRPMMAVSVLSAVRTPVFSGVPFWIFRMKVSSESMVISRGHFSVTESVRPR